MKGAGAAAIVFLVFIFVILAFFYVNYVNPDFLSAPIYKTAIPDKAPYASQAGTFSLRPDLANDIIYVDNRGPLSGFDVFVDGVRMAKTEELTTDGAILTLDEPLPAGQHNLSVIAGNQYVDQTINVEEKWIVDFTITAG